MKLHAFSGALLALAAAAPGAAPAPSPAPRTTRVPCEVMHLYYEQVERAGERPRPPQTPAEWNRVLRRFT
jgi:hypothetical protein